VDLVGNESDDSDSFEEDNLGTSSRITVNLKSIKPIKPIQAPIDLGSRIKSSPMQNNFLRLPTRESNHQNQNGRSHTLGMGSMTFGSVVDHQENQDKIEIPGQMDGIKTSMGSGSQRCQEDSNKCHWSGSLDSANKIQGSRSPLVVNARNDSLAGREDNTNEIDPSIGDSGGRNPVEWNLDDFPDTSNQEFAMGRISTDWVGLTKQNPHIKQVCEAKSPPKIRLSNKDLVSNELANKQRYITGLETRIQRHEAKLTMFQHIEYKQKKNLGLTVNVNQKGSCTWELKGSNGSVTRQGESSLIKEKTIMNLAALKGSGGRVWSQLFKKTLFEDLKLYLFGNGDIGINLDHTKQADGQLARVQFPREVIDYLEVSNSIIEAELQTNPFFIRLVDSWIAV
jgi:hypothetical protein